MLLSIPVIATLLSVAVANPTPQIPPLGENNKWFVTKWGAFCDPGGICRFGFDIRGDEKVGKINVPKFTANCAATDVRIDGNKVACRITDPASYPSGNVREVFAGLISGDPAITEDVKLAIDYKFKEIGGLESTWIISATDGVFFAGAQDFDIPTESFQKV
ncbi:hypothetical protein HYALB_00006788 [Hymenoscyphus albidus]|uniref:Uncharacterized protein n=1 Tax=Hymenoscyphus albidus TaxID=595503 RepID=A0A9N9QDS7_9HELO|nr:hypothetical protein HYALB_00006788 [Hymenoscyphus albidus]